MSVSSCCCVCICVCLIVNLLVWLMVCCLRVCMCAFDCLVCFCLDVRACVGVGFVLVCIGLVFASYTGVVLVLF